MIIRSPILNLLKPVSECKTVQEVLEAIGANFEVEKRTPYFQVENCTIFKPYNRAAVIVRKDNNEGLGVCSDNYGIVQYNESIEFLNSLITEGKAQFFTAGTTDGGARLHVIMKANDYVDLGNGEKVDFYFYVVTSHDSTASVTAMVTPLHNISQTVFTPLDNGVVKFKHSKNVKDRMKKAASIYTQMNNEWRSYTTNFKNFTTSKLTPVQVEGYFRAVSPGDSTQAGNTRKKLLDIYHRGEVSSLNSCSGTLWGAFMAVQIYADMYKTTKKSSKGRSEVEARIEGRLTGAAARQKAFSYSQALKFINLSR